MNLQVQTPTLNHVYDLSGRLPLIHLGQDLVLPTYYLVISLTACACILWLIKRAQSRHMSRQMTLDLCMILMISGFLGARAFHIFFEEPDYYFQDPLRSLEIWRGGFVWYGGALTGAFSSWLYLKNKHVALGPWLDLFAPVCAFGYGAGRIACFLTGCCYGKVCELPATLSSNPIWRHPTQVYATLWELASLFLLLWLERRVQKRTSNKPFFGLFFGGAGLLFVFWLGTHAIGRILMEHFRADPRGVELLGLSQATWISILLLINVIGIFFFRAKKLTTANKPHG